MNTKTIKLKAFFLALAACFMSFTVVLASAHAKDLVRDSSHDLGVVGRTSDMNAKSISDLHNHIDKQTLKSIVMDNPVTAREREIKALSEERLNRNVLEVIEETLIFYRLAFALRFSLALA